MREEFLAQVQKVIEHLQHQLKQIRTGRAHSSLVEDLSILVEAYGGARMPLKELASISTPDVTLLVIQPYDRSVLKDIEKSITQSDLGISPVSKDNAIHLVVPSLTQERRQQFVKTVKDKVEEARVAVRNVRTDIKKMIEEQKGEAGISEDDIKRQLDELQQAVDETMSTLDNLGEKKEHELMQL